jgi:cyclophilin family peptidyl-prolyl cis-trans isomerase
MKQALGWLCVLALGCSKPSPSRGEPAGPAPVATLSSAEVLGLLQAEHRRDPSAVAEELVASVSGPARVAAVRSLARIAAAKSLPLLIDALSDEEPEVIEWAAFGVGQLCRDHEPEAVRRLALRAASLATEPPSEPVDRALSGVALSLGRCASDDAERTLRSWLRLRAPIAAGATLGLAQLARQRKRLDDATIAALLDFASKRPDSAALHPIESLPSLGVAARERLLEVARTALESPQPDRAYAVRALAKGGPPGAEPLRRLLDADETTHAERADAARALSALGPAGQVELAGALPRRARALIDQKAWLTGEHGVVLTLLEALEPGRADSALLTELSQLPLSDEPAPIVRRKVMLRCRAAALLAGRASQSAALLACDPSPAAERREGALATLTVLGRGPLTGARGKRFAELARSEDRVVREAALELLTSHDEVEHLTELLASALLAEEVGVSATAAKVLARYPSRAQLPAEGQAAPVLAPGVVQALSKRLQEVGAPRNLELSAALLDAGAALSLLGVKPAVERACASTSPTLRRHAERAYVQLGEPNRRCQDVPSKEAWPGPLLGDVRVELDTDAGPLSITLKGEASPFAVARFVELTRSGFFDGMAVHRVVPGFVAQFGDPGGDGFGGADLPPLRCQTSPDGFRAGSVGVALAGRDTGVSQFFVTLRPAPHLAGEYSLIGEASGAWERLAAGDRIIKARVLEGPAK